MELIDIFNENHKYLGVCEKELAHKLGLWHEVFNGIIVNKENKSIIFQIKNAKHNQVHDMDKIDISVGGHYQAGEKIEDGIREIKEESGIEIDFRDLVYLGERQVSTIVKEDYIVREFQKIFIVPYNGSITNLKCQDDEVNGFIEFEIDNCIDLFLKNKTSIIGVDNNQKNVEVTLKNFVESYLNGDELYLRLAIASKRFIEGERKELLKW